MDRIPDTPTPIGLLVGFLALFPAAFSGLAFYGAYHAFGPATDNPELGRELLKWGLYAALPALAGLGYSLYRLATTGRRRQHRIGQTLHT